MSDFTQYLNLAYCMLLHNPTGATAPLLEFSRHCESFISPLGTLATAACSSYPRHDGHLHNAEVKVVSSYGMHQPRRKMRFLQVWEGVEVRNYGKLPINWRLSTAY